MATPKEKRKKVARKTAAQKSPSAKVLLRKSLSKKSSRLSSKITSKSKMKFTLALRGKKNITAKLSPTKEMAVSPSYAPHIQSKRFLQEEYALPSSYDTTQLALIVRDPHWVYAYWDIAPSSVAKISQQIGDEVHSASYVLRLYEVSYIDFNGTNANHFFDIDVGPFTKNWYINLWADNASYCADLGLRTRDGKFHPLVRSNFITTPRVTTSPRSDVIWMEVKEEKKAETFIYVGGKRDFLSNRWRNGNGRRIMLTDEEIRAYYARHFALLRQILLRRFKSEEIEQMYGVFEQISIPTIDDLLQGELTHKQFLRKIRTGSSEEVLVEETASVREARQRKFFFEIGTELIVYGRTEADAKVTLNGKDVALRSDGTFSLRYVLHESKIPLDFNAHSSNGIDKRSIKTAVERQKTEYRDKV